LTSSPSRCDASVTCCMHSNALVLTRSLPPLAASCPLLPPRLALRHRPFCRNLASSPSRCSSCSSTQMLLSIASAALNRVLPRAASPASIGRSMSTGANYVS
jgi:hypothetical protein